ELRVRPRPALLASAARQARRRSERRLSAAVLVTIVFPAIDPARAGSLTSGYLQRQGPSDPPYRNGKGQHDPHAGKCRNREEGGAERVADLRPGDRLTAGRQLGDHA